MQLIFLKQIIDDDQNDEVRIHFQLDGAPPHNVEALRRLLNNRSLDSRLEGEGQCSVTVSFDMLC